MSKTITPRDVMLYLDYLYEGDDIEIKNHIRNQLPMDTDKLIEISTERDTPDLITRADNDYPKQLEGRKVPPYVIPRGWAIMINIRKEYANVN